MENEFILSEIETDDPLSGDEKRAMKTARDFLGGMMPGQGLRISITRTRPGWIPGGGGWLETVDFSPDGQEFSLEGLRETYGGGTYVLKVLNEKGKFLAAQTVKIAGDPIHQGRRITQQMAEAQLMPQVSTAPARDTETAELIKALLANSSKAQQDSFNLLLSLWNNQAKPTGKPTSLDELANMIKFVDDIRGGQQPAEDPTMAGMMGLLSQFMASKQVMPPPVSPIPQQQRAPMKFFAPPVMSAKSQAVNPVPIMNNPVNSAPVMSAQSQPVPAAPVVPAPVVSAPESEKKNFELDDLEFHGDEEQEIDIADDIAAWPVDEIVQLIADVMAKLPETKTLQLMEKMKTT